MCAFGFREQIVVDFKIGVGKELPINICWELH